MLIREYFKLLSLIRFYWEFEGTHPAVDDVVGYLNLREELSNLIHCKVSDFSIQKLEKLSWSKLFEKNGGFDFFFMRLVDDIFSTVSTTTPPKKEVILYKKN